jgi:nucleoside-diphosphate-sugar epimerase
VLAERLFAAAADENGRWDSIACCPGDNVGPIQSAHQKERGAWQSQIAGMLAGRCTQNGVYRPWMTVDVRDNALAHIGLLESTRVRNGERYMACSEERRNVEDICASIARLLPELNHATPPVTDMQNERIKAREAEYRAIWAGTQVRNDRIRAATGVTFRPLDDSIRDCVESLIAIGGVKVKRREATSETVTA